MRARVGALLVVAVLSLSVWAMPAAPSEVETTDATVQVSNFRFDPASVAIDAGDQVTWQWAGGTHSIESLTGELWCGTRSSGSCSKVFTTPGTINYRCGVHPSSMLGSIEVAGVAPAVAIDAPADGLTFEAAFAAAGTATHADGITSVQWRIDNGAYKPVDTFVPGTEASWSTQVDPTGLAVGLHTLEVRAAVASGITGVDTITFRFQAPDAIDLRITGLTDTTAPRSAQLRATVDNVGTLDVNDAVLRFEYLYHGTWRSIGEVTLDLLAGRSVSRFVTWDSGGKIGGFEVRAVIDPDGLLAEANEGNNERTGRAGFVNKDVPGFDPFEPV